MSFIRPLGCIVVVRAMRGIGVRVWLVLGRARVGYGRGVQGYYLGEGVSKVVNLFERLSTGDRLKQRRSE